MKKYLATLSIILTTICSTHAMAQESAPQNLDLLMHHTGGEVLLPNHIAKPKEIPLLTKCKDSEIINMPSIESCPRIAGYVAIGFASCTQKFKVPKKLIKVETDFGFTRFMCKLDFLNAEPVSEKVCDYSACQYIEEPVISFDGVTL